MSLHGGEGCVLRLIGGFDAWEASLCLGISVKQASNCLRRLHQMGFLKKKRTKRRCLSHGKTCYRGFKYIYSFSKQGSSYVKWLREWKPVEDLYYARLTSDIISTLPQGLRNEISVLSLFRASWKYRGSTRNLRLFDNDAVPLASLITRNLELAEENKKLMIENEVMRFKLEQNAKEKEQSGTLNQLLTTIVVEATKYKREAEHYCSAFNLAKRVIEDTRKFAEKTFSEYRNFEPLAPIESNLDSTD